MIRTTRWHPDTCGCVVEYEWDDAEPDDARTHRPSKVVQQCASHAGLTHAQVHAAVLDENPRKNRALAAIMETAPGITEKRKSDDGSEVVDFKPGQRPTWRFDKDRQLVVTLPAEAKALRAVVKARLDKDHGAGKTKVD